MGKLSSAAPSNDDRAVAVATQPRSFANILFNIGRHVLPLVLLYLRGSVASYLLLTAFDLSLGLMLIVGTTRDRKDPTTVDPRSRWLVSRVAAILFLAVFFAIVASIVAMPIFMPAFFLSLSSGIDWWALVHHRTFWLTVGTMALLAACEAQASFESTTVAGPRGQPTQKAPVIGNLEEDRQRSLAANAAQVTLIVTYVCLCFVLISFGYLGFTAFPVLYTAILLFYDARPDIAHRIFPEAWRAK